LGIFLITSKLNLVNVEKFYNQKDYRSRDQVL
jgi:hypothetical protein